MKPIFEFRQSPNRIPTAETEFWIALMGPLSESGHAYVLGRMCKTRAESKVWLRKYKLTSNAQSPRRARNSDRAQSRRAAAHERSRRM
jgi:hypothetical protein